MGKAAAALSALREGGPRELITKTRFWGARARDPGTTPLAPVDRPVARPPVPRAKANAANVRFAQATKFFEQRHANYEALADAVKPHLPPDGVLFDIGANIGYFSMVVGNRTGFRGAAHLFEPIPHLAQFCFRTLTDVDFSVAVHQYGLSDADGEVDIFIDTLGNFGWNTMIGERAQNMTKQRILVRRFDGIDLTVVPSVIKIDVEGAEYLVLRGLLPSIRSWEKRPPILCEIGWGAAGHPAWEAELAVFAELLELGYRATTLQGEPVVLEEVDRTCDVMFLPE
jgi:FkbM family methyltransferase